MPRNSVDASVPGSTVKTESVKVAPLGAVPRSR